ncbi:MAG: endonuclease domain-containing protein [Patescibacteria group bacterium]
MTVIYNKGKQKETRRRLRKDSTETEKIMWDKLRNRKLGEKFRRQYGIGHYIADFCCPIKKLIIEIDGEIHNEQEQILQEQILYDQERSKDIKELGFKVIRFTNTEVKNNLDNVVNKIKKEINNR